MARQVVRDPRGYPDASVRLPAGADAGELAELCREHTARLHAWLAALDEPTTQASDARLVARYTGTMGSAIAIFRGHTISTFNSVAANTRRTYGESLKVIEGTVAARVNRNVTLVDVRRWYREWRKPASAGAEERIDRAHDAVQMVRAVWRFCAGLGAPFRDCKEALERLGKARFENGSGRDTEMTSAQAFAFVRTALELGARGVQPAERMLAMAIGVAAQFEMALRQRDIIGKWVPAMLDTPHAEYDHKGEMWVGAFRWDNIPGWKFRLRTSKRGAPSGFALTDYPILFPLLERVPHAQRLGAIVKGEHGLPVRERSYRNWYRQVARAAGIPDEVWNMDSRAGAATEAEDAGVDVTLIQDLLTHSDARMTAHYIRRRERGNAEVAKARAEHRAKQGGER
jgi:hypothetical protein